MLTVDFPKSSLGPASDAAGALANTPPPLRRADINPPAVFELQCLNLHSALAEVELMLKRFDLITPGQSRADIWAPMIDDHLADSDSNRYRLLESLLVRAAHRHAAWRIDTTQTTDQPTELHISTALPVAVVQQLLAVVEPAATWLGLTPAIARVPSGERLAVLEQLLA
jgi:hypothetical protein